MRFGVSSKLTISSPKLTSDRRFWAHQARKRSKDRQEDAVQATEPKTQDGDRLVTQTGDNVIPQ